MDPNSPLFPEIEPYRTGRLQVSDLHTLYYEEVGNPQGQPVVVLHGGPGAGISPLMRRFFDPQFYRVILFDQRGSGQSTPFAELSENTTWDLVADIERLRTRLGIARWLVFGGSWGSGAPRWCNWMRSALLACCRCGYHKAPGAGRRRLSCWGWACSWVWR